MMPCLLGAVGRGARRTMFLGDFASPTSLVDLTGVHAGVLQNDGLRVAVNRPASLIVGSSSEAVWPTNNTVLDRAYFTGVTRPTSDPAHPFTLEMFFRASGVGANRGYMYSGGKKFMVVHNSSNTFGLITYYAATQLFTSAGSTPTLNAVHHMCLQSDGLYLRLYIDGVKRAEIAKSPTSWDGWALETGNDGAIGYGALGIVGACSEFRLTDRVRYAIGGFTPPAPGTLIID